MRSATELGIRTVVVYSEADCAALQIWRAVAVQPGYGFLAENADFT